jgi:hypothetical protein
MRPARASFLTPGRNTVRIAEYLRPATRPAATSLLTGLAMLGLALGAPATAAEPVVNEKFSDFDPAIKMLREEVGQDRREVVQKAMLLTATEAKMFWPLYDEYRAEMHKLGDRRVRLITDFAARRNGMSQDEAERMTKEALSIEKDGIEVKEDYVKKMSKQLSSRTVARFFQIDAKLDALVNVALAANIPLIY